MLPFDLILWDDDLAGLVITSVGDGVVQDADDSDHLTHIFDAVGNVAGVADKLLAPGNLKRYEQPKIRGSFLTVKIQNL